MAVLTAQQRNTLESAVKEARRAVEKGAFNALHSFGVDNTEPFQHLTAAERALRNKLRAKSRLLGDELPATGEQNISNLCYELAYETWHKMLFAKFLEANDLLMHPDGVAVTLTDCEELAHDENFVDKWDAAANYASRMLPAIFRTEDPLMQVPFATNDRIALETIIDALENNIFTADDSLGWVYQFWQSEAKAAINASGDKIDGAKLPAVTQLFTEPYMVHFLIDNTLGAWWVSRNPGVTPPIKFEYLRYLDNVAPASSRSNNNSNNNNNNSSIETASSRSIEINYYNPYEELSHIKGNLPHWRQEGKLYFVTFRTADSMPQELLKEWEYEMEAWKSQNPEPHTPEQKKEYYKRFPAKMQEYLDAGYGACQLKNEKIKILVENALKFFNGDRYELDEYVVAANHVHVLVAPKENNQLSDILHSWKSYTANEIHKITNESGAFWQKESFDHLVRSEASLDKFRVYIKNHNRNIETASSRLNTILRQDGGATLALPAAGTFEGWPNKTADVTSLDPCMGSGHFVASLFPVFASLRMYEEGLTKEEATDRVITENLHGLELDPRCTQIAAFNLALTAWKFCGAYRTLPEMNLACSGIAPKGKVEDWVKLVDNVNEDDRGRMENGMRMLYDHFQLAPELGSLLDPSTIKADAFTASFEQLQPILNKALQSEIDTEQVERGVMAAGIAKAGEIMSKKYTMQITNVPYLSSVKQGEILTKYCQLNYSEAKGELATVFLEYMLNKAIVNGTVCCVIPQNWLFKITYKKFRNNLLRHHYINLIARLGTKSFQTPMFDFNVMLVVISNSLPNNEANFTGIDVSNISNPIIKSDNLKIAVLSKFNQTNQLNNPDLRLILDSSINHSLLSNYSDSYWGLGSGDYPNYGRLFWEIDLPNKDWIFQLSTISNSTFFSGREYILLWENGKGRLSKEPGAFLRGQSIWGKKGIHVTQTAHLPVTIYTGECWDSNSAPIIPKKEEYFNAIWAFCSSPEFNLEVRKIDQSLKVTNATLVKIPFDLEYWQKVADEKYPNGLPKPYSEDATQWLFHGHPIKSDNPLQVAVARLLGYRWPAESDDKMELADEARELIAAVKEFDSLTDDDGIFCIPSVNGEQAGADRVREYLQAVFATEWNNSSLNQLFTKEGANSANLEDWLRKEFFAQHCKLFQNRPFIWHVWDGRPDGFSALVNYHKLDKDNLSKLIYTYLGDWIRMCESKKNNQESGAEGLLSAALKLKEKLELILEGEAPYDIFVRWKALEQQPIGWEPDLNDGVRLNVRPFAEAGILRTKFNVKWGIDRGKNPLGTPWGEIRDNDLHKSLVEKRTAREKNNLWVNN